MENDILIIAIICFVIIFSLISHFINISRNKKKIKALIKERWGKEPKKLKSEKIRSVSEYFNDKLKEDPNRHIIDNITWNDLDMENVFMRINNTSSSVGEEYLYSILREPSFDAGTLSERNRLIEFFRNNKEKREQLQFLLASLGKVDDINVSDYFFGASPKSTGNALLYNILGLLALIAPLFVVINFSYGLLFFIIIFVINMSIYYKSKNELGSYLESLSYVVRLVSCAKKIDRLNWPELSEYTNKLNKSYKSLKAIEKKAFNLLYTSGDVLVEYAKIAFLRELANYESIIRVLSKHLTELRNIYETVGLLDSLIAAASFRESVDFWCTPEFDTKSASNEIPRLSFTDAYHPMLKNPVANSLKMEKSILITGSNASGKSTFIKTAAINTILAQTLFTCLAKEYHTGFFKIFSSMALHDDLSNNESYYIAEIKSLKRIFDNLDNNIPCICFIDEVLRGTNTIERIAASSEVLHNLSMNNCICVTATHDIELTRILSDYYANYHFQEKITDSGIEFDYKIYEGRSNTRNAIKLLKFMGYDDSLVIKAEERAMEFIEKGMWKRA